MTFTELAKKARQMLNDPLSIEVTNEEVLSLYNLSLSNLELILESSLVPFNESEVEIRSGDELPKDMCMVQSVLASDGTFLSLANFETSDERHYYIKHGRIFIKKPSATLKYSKAFERVSLLQIEEWLEREVTLQEGFLEYVIYSILHNILLRLGEDASNVKVILDTISRLLTLSSSHRYGYNFIRHKRRGYE